MNRINSFFRDNATKKEPDVTVAVIPEAKSDTKPRRWKPTTLRRPFLLAVICITLGLLALVQALVIKDDQNDGLLFAPRISELGAFDTFLHQYLPTTIAVLFGLLWSWIDLDVRRIEPYRQLSKPGGASGQNSLLLHYPYDFLGFVPFTSFKRKHWPVFMSSCALIMVAWGVTPLQGAIFATDTVTKLATEQMQLSNHHLSIEDQTTEVTANYTYSASNIVWLGERLPAFMAKEAAFSAFRLNSGEPQQMEETLTARTTSFSVDLHCETPVLNETDDRLESSHGCRVPLAFGPDGTDVMGNDPDRQYEIKEFAAFFAGNQNHDGLADYYLSPYCPDNVTDVFMVSFAKNRPSNTAPPGPVTRLFCQTSYIEQAATATIRRVDGSVMDASEFGHKSPLRPGLFNTSLHEWQINSATQQNTVRGAVPMTDWPDQGAQLAQMALTMPPSFVKSSKVIGLAIGTYKRPLEDYLDPQVLAAMFQAYNRLLFARAMADVLSVDFEEAEVIDGTRTYQSEAVRVVPGFAYAVEGLFGLVTILAIFLMIISWRDTLILQKDPDSVTALMTLVSGQDTILEQFSQHDQSTSKVLKADIRHSIYALEPSMSSAGSALGLKTVVSGPLEAEKLPSGAGSPPSGYPAELSRKAGACLAIALASVIAATAYLYHTAKGSGLPLPSQNRFVRQMLQNYVPTIIATIIEPVWVLLNRIICTMQPFEGLRSGKAQVQRSIGLNYSSLPPQLVILKALKARHFVLAAVCLLALLANLLAVAFAGIFNEEAVLLNRPTFAAPLFEPRFRSNIENMTDSGPNAFYSAMANFTSATPMPVWADDEAFYLPVSLPRDLNKTDHFQVQTTAFGMELDCNAPQVWNYTLTSQDSRNYGNITATVSGQSGLISCFSNPLMSPWSFNQQPCSQQPMAVEVISPLVANENSTAAEQEECPQLFVGVWGRRPVDQLCEGKEIVLTESDATALVCRPSLVRHAANVTISGTGTVEEVLSATDSGTAKPIEESKRTLEEMTEALLQHKVNGIEAGIQSYGGQWHNDSFPSDWNSYVMSNLDPDSGVLDPKLPPPDLNIAVTSLSRAFRKTSAIWLSLNHEEFLVASDAHTATLVGTIMRPEVRIMVSESMAIISITILGLYILVAFAVYAQQPARFLPRMPTTIASDLALFAASKAVGEMGHSTGQDHKAPLGESRFRFGYGPFVGTDGKAHVGIERSPYVNTV